MNPTEIITDFITNQKLGDLDDMVVDRITAAIIDYVGVVLAGLPEESFKIVKKLVESMGGDPQASVWGTEIKTSVILAAMANGTAAHALDYDDINPVMMAHPSIHLLPGLFALGEYEHAPGRQIIESYAVGFEVGAKLGRAMNPRLVFNGWLPIGVLGTIMQTAACCKLLRLPPQQVRMSLGIASNLAAGLRANNGTMAKPLLAGVVGSNGIIAALLARDGMTANPKALEDKLGFFDNFSKGDISDLDKAFETLGEEPLEILRSGIVHKLYACCGGGHMSIDGALEIVSRHDFRPDDIEKVEISIHEGIKFFLIHSTPKTGAEAKFSLEYAVARAILDGQMGPAQFGPEKIRDPQVVSLMKKIERKDYDTSENPPPVEIHIYLKDGQIFSSRVTQIKGTPKKPVSQSELDEKFYQCAEMHLEGEAITRLLNQLKQFRELTDICDLIPLINGFTK